ncbi:GGDEF domain-containing protein [Alicyclobacillaceae bacterium I2511]|nr:GGDEF domain-containing protein [Alicyclobacillaceae bacterium I2511]
MPDGDDVYATLLRKVRDYEWLDRCSEPFTTATDVVEMMNHIRAGMMERFEFDRFGILVATVNNHYCIIHEVVTRQDMEPVPAGSLMLVENTGVQRVFNTRCFHYNPDVAHQPEFVEDAEFIRMGLRSIVRLPLLSAGQVLGVMTVKSVQPHRYNSQDVQLMERIAGKFSAGIRSLKLIYDLREASFKDSLTHVMNRRFLTEVADQPDSGLLEEVTGLPTPKDPTLTVLFVDINDFKQLNDQNGHSVGDKRLQDVAQLLLHITRDRGFVVRYGGDEFLVVLPAPIIGVEEQVYRQILDGVAVLNNKLPDIRPIHLSLGLAHGDWYHLDALIHQADMAMYAHKSNQNQSNQYQSNQNQPNPEAQSRLARDTSPET